MGDRRLIRVGDRSDFGAAESDHEVSSLALACHRLQIIRRLPGSGEAMVAQDVRTIAHDETVKHRATGKEHDEPTNRMACRRGALGDDVALCGRRVHIESLCSITNARLTLAERHFEYS